jgi:hypothetical protein
MFGSAGTKVDQDGTTTIGEDIDINQSAIQVDWRLYLEPLGNWRNWRIFSNIVMGNWGHIGVSNPYIGLQLTKGITGGNVGLRTDQHGSGGEMDTAIKRKYQGAVKLIVGAQVVDAGKYGSLNAQAGVSFSRYEYIFMTGEDQGGGNYEESSMDDNTVAPFFGGEYNNYIDYGNTGFGPSTHGGLRIGVHTEYVPGFDFRAMTETFGINYNVQTEGTWVGTVRVGWGIYF